MLIDGDPLGGGIDLALGGEDTAGLRWPELSAAGGRLSSNALLSSVPELDGLAVLSCDRHGVDDIPVAAMQAVLAAGRRSSDLVVVDLPRRVDPATALVLAEADVTLLLVPAEVRATAAAARVAAVLLPLTRDLHVLVRGPSPGGLSGKSVADALGLPLMGWLDAEPGMAQATDRGQPPARSGKGPLAEACRGVLSQLQVRHRPAA
jgi:secretion/DNA translocation related CpaE-like protein